MKTKNATTVNTTVDQLLDQYQNRAEFQQFIYTANSIKDTDLSKMEVLLSDED